jgi:spore coat polysaccharide biosynthesis protein SpsF
MDQEQKRIVAIVQARMSSSRLPGKVLKDISGKPMLLWVVERAKRAISLQDVAVATTTDPSDDPIVDLCREKGIPVLRGNLLDVLDRFYQAALALKAGVIVRLTADCPVIDPQVIDQVVGKFLQAGVDFAANRLPPPWKRTFPIGLDTEVCTFEALQRAWKEATQSFEREHVMPYFYDQGGRFKTLLVDHEPDYGSYRWTVDTEEDLEAVRQIFSKLGGDGSFSWEDILELYAREPDLAAINSQVRHKSAHDVDERMKP